MVGPGLQLTDACSGRRLGAVDDLVGEVLDVVQAVLIAQRQQPLRTDLAGRHLRVEVAGHVVGLADVGQDELPDVVVALATPHQLDDRDPQTLFEHVATAGADAVAADVGVVDGGAEQRDDPAAAPDRDEHRHVEQLARRLVRIVGDQDVALLQGVERVLLQDVDDRHGQAVDVPRRSGDRLGDHAPAAVEHGVREVAGFAHDRAERRALQRAGLLVHRGDEALPADLEFDRVEGPSHRAAPFVGSDSLRVAIMLPSAPTSTFQPGRTTAVVSRSSTMAGPLNRSPAPSSLRRYTGVSMASIARPNTTGRVRNGCAPVPAATGLGSTGSASAEIASRQVTISTGTSGIVSPKMRRYSVSNAASTAASSRVQAGSLGDPDRDLVALAGVAGVEPVPVAHRVGARSGGGEHAAALGPQVLEHRIAFGGVDGVQPSGHGPGEVDAHG